MNYDVDLLKTLDCRRLRSIREAVQSIFELILDPCTDKEEGILAELHKEDDNNWAMLSRFLPGDPKHHEESLERDEKEEEERLLNQQHGLNRLYLRLNSHFNGGKPS
ncbi:hypothetical protein Droror1_Dr00013225 [Drosera rotundifolia]